MRERRGGRMSGTRIRGPSKWRQVTVIPDSSDNSSPNPFHIERRTFHAVQGLDGLVWTKEERAVLQAFLSHYTSKEGVNVPILEVGEGDRSPGGSRMLSESAGFREGGIGA